MRTVLLICAFLLSVWSSDEPQAEPYRQPQLLGTFDWSILFSTNMPSRMSRGNDILPYFDFPTAPGSVHYIAQTPAAKIAPGQSIIMSFAIQGDGTIVPTEGGPPGRLRLFLWQKGDDLSGARKFEFYRWWSLANVELKNGDFILSVKIVPEEWSSVFGKVGTASAAATSGFHEAINNLYAYGFTFGGQFAGHGDYVKNGDARFVLKSYKLL